MALLLYWFCKGQTNTHADHHVAEKVKKRESKGKQCTEQRLLYKIHAHLPSSSYFIIHRRLHGTRFADSDAPIAVTTTNRFTDLAYWM